MKYVMIVEVSDAELDGDDSIENAAAVVNRIGSPWVKVRPLSEEIAC